MSDTVHRQGIGLVHAIPAADLVPGTRLVWNYSYGECEVVSIEPASAEFLFIQERNRKTGEVYQRRRKIKRTTLVGIVLVKS